MFLHIDRKKFGSKMKALAQERNLIEMRRLSTLTRESFDSLAKEFPQETVLWGGDEILLEGELEILQKAISRLLEITNSNICDFHLRFSEDFADFYKG